MKSFFKKDIQIDMDVFQNFDFNNLASWSQIEIWCILHGKPVDFNTFKFFIFGSTLYKDVYDMMMSSLQTTDQLNDFIKNVETVELLYSLKNNFNSNKRLINKWSRLCKYDIQFEFDDKKYFNLLIQIFKKNPITILKFYSKYQYELHRYDSKFINIMSKLVKDNSLTNSSFQKIYDIIEKNSRKYRKINMFMN